MENLFNNINEGKLSNYKSLNIGFGGLKTYITAHMTYPWLLKSSHPSAPTVYGLVAEYTCPPVIMRMRDITTYSPP